MRVLLIAFGEWKRLGADAWRAHRLRRKLQVLFGPALILCPGRPRPPSGMTLRHWTR